MPFCYFVLIFKVWVWKFEFEDFFLFLLHLILHHNFGMSEPGCPLILNITLLFSFSKLSINYQKWRNYHLGQHKSSLQQLLYLSSQSIQD